MVTTEVAGTGPEPLTPEAAAEIARLAGRARTARGVLMKVIALAGSKAENALDALPGGVRAAIGAATERALALAYRGAEVSGKAGPVPEMGRHGHAIAATVSGAAGGIGGLGSTLVELPVTVGIIFAAIQRAARAEGFDPAEEVVRRHCLMVFAAGDPADPSDDGANTSFLASRAMISGATVHRLISAVAPRLAAVLTEKLAAQAVPLLGSVAGAGINYAFTRYYQELAEIRFALLRLAQQHGEEAVTAAFRAETALRAGR
ncbi:EcsC family protein [Albidovulum sp.]|uniref:EcsC family protein n=1 Tax=Albidovulum sp. TaxID=1872424 RepID=UPI0039B94936